MDTLSTHNTFWQNYFGISNEVAFQTLTPVAITLFVFITGLLFNRWREKSKEKQNDNLIRAFVFSQIDVLLKAITKQIANIEKFLVQLSENKVINFEFELSIEFNSKHIRYIKSNELFKVFVIIAKKSDKDKLDKFNSLIKQLDLIDGLNDSFKSSFAYIIEHLNNYQNYWNENIDIIGDLHDKWITHLTMQNIDPRNDPFLKEFIEIYHQWAKIENRQDIYVATTALINPVLEKARALQPNVYGEALLRPLLHCYDSYANHKNLRELKTKEFNHYKSQLQSIEAELKKVNENN